MIFSQKCGKIVSFNNPLTPMKALLDYIPIIVFFVLYKTTNPTDKNHPLLTLFGAQGVDNNHLLVATAGMLIATLIIYAIIFVIQKFRLEKMQIFMVGMMIVFGGITLVLSDDFYIRLKAVLINALFGFGVLLSPLFLKVSAVQKLFGSVFDMPNTHWQKLNMAWAGLFFVMAGLHGFFAFVFADGRYWGEFTAFGDIGVMIVFVVAMMIVLKPYLKLDNPNAQDNPFKK